MSENGDEEFKKFLDDDGDDHKCPYSVSKEEMILKTIETKTDSILGMTNTLLSSYTDGDADDDFKDVILERALSMIDLFTESVKTYDYLLTRLIDDEDE